MMAASTSEFIFIQICAGLPALARELPELAGHAHALEGLLQLRGETVWLLAPYRFEVR